MKLWWYFYCLLLNCLKLKTSTSKSIRLLCVTCMVSSLGVSFKQSFKFWICKRSRKHIKCSIPNHWLKRPPVGSWHLKDWRLCWTILWSTILYGDSLVNRIGRSNIEQISFDFRIPSHSIGYSIRYGLDLMDSSLNFLQFNSVNRKLESGGIIGRLYRFRSI